jgi:hypothetical protein
MIQYKVFGVLQEKDIKYLKMLNSKIIHKRPWWRQGALPQSNPFGALGLAYCIYCKQEVDVDTEAHHEGTLYVWRQRCLRCGRYCNFGMYQNVPLFNNTGLSHAALEWVFTPGKDRR